mmetsp:Transcript_50582/g.133565  ORF Transcript_50582/g.133565 Transcript_50582/m.133565 type:complete len:138 (+) Transcript_50582:107-520(+)
MSSLSQAVAQDYHRNKEGIPARSKHNPVALTGKQEGQSGPLLDDFYARKEEERKAVRLMREAEGGRGGGYNERASAADRKPVQDDDDDFDEYGRRKKPKEAQALSKAERAKLALERLKAKTKGVAGSSRDRSRSPRR